MYILFIILIIIAAILLILTVMVQSPKSGMAANFGASNQVMGVRQTADFLEKMTWGLSTAILVLCLAATMSMSSLNKTNNQLEEAIQQQLPMENMSLPNQFGGEVPAEAPAGLPVE